MESLREPLSVHTYVIDAFGALSVPALAGFLGEAAGRHADALGVGLETLMARGLTWVLGRQRFEIAEPPRLGERLEVETWPSGVDRLVALRDFVVRGPDGGERVRAITQWIVMDLATRRPVRPHTVLDARFAPKVAHAVEFTAGKLPELAAWAGEQRFHIRYADIDRNLHVNNGSYLAWAIEAMPREVWERDRLASLEVQFLAECRLGSTILSRVAASGPDAYAHAIVREEDGKELARLATTWVRRGG
jgi:acyl-ACP thioesterase